MANTQLAFGLDSPYLGRVKGERNINAYPFWDLDRQAKSSEIAFEDSSLGVNISVRAGWGVGCPTIYDKDLILYVASILADRLNTGLLTGDSDKDRTVVFTVHDFFRVSGRDTSARSYANFEKMLVRLKTCQIKTNIEVSSGPDEESEGMDVWWNWFESGTAISYRKNRKGERAVKSVRVVLGKWLYNAIVHDRRILTYSTNYFDLGPVERRLYDLARVHVGKQEKFAIRLPKLRERVGYRRRLSTFLSELLEIAKRDPLPEYTFKVLTVERPGAVRRSKRDIEQTTVIFTPKEKSREPTSAEVIDLRPVEPAKHPGLVRQLTGLRLTHLWERVDHMNQIRKGRGLEPLPRKLADDVPALAAAMVELGMERDW